MTESLMGFTLGVLIVVVASLLWKAQGKRQEWQRKVDEALATLQKDAEMTARLLESGSARAQALSERIGQLKDVILAPGAGAPDAAIAQLAGRLSQLEKAHAAQDLTILETAEKVAHKLQDRRRKRDQAEIGEIDEAPNDPAQLLAEARRAYGVTAPDPAQLQLIGGE